MASEKPISPAGASSSSPDSALSKVGVSSILRELRRNLLTVMHGIVWSARNAGSKDPSSNPYPVMVRFGFKSIFDAWDVKRASLIVRPARASQPFSDFMKFAMKHSSRRSVVFILLESDSETLRTPMLCLCPELFWPSLFQNLFRTDVFHIAILELMREHFMKMNFLEVWELLATKGCIDPTNEFYKAWHKKANDKKIAAAEIPKQQRNFAIELFVADRDSTAVLAMAAAQQFMVDRITRACAENPSTGAFGWQGMVQYPHDAGRGTQRGTEHLQAFVFFDVQHHIPVGQQATVLLHIHYLCVRDSLERLGIASTLLDLLVTQIEALHPGHNIEVEIEAKRNEKAPRFWFDKQASTDTEERQTKPFPAQRRSQWRTFSSIWESSLKQKQSTQPNQHSWSFSKHDREQIRQARTLAPQPLSPPAQLPPVSPSPPAMQPSAKKLC